MTKTSAFPAASRLTGSESIGVITNGYTYQTTVGAISDIYATILNSGTSFSIARGATVDGGSATTIGYGSYASVVCTALGLNVGATETLSTVIGYNSYAHALGVSIGPRNQSRTVRSITIGHLCYANGSNGYDSAGIAIGKDAVCRGTSALGIGNELLLSEASIGIGYNIYTRSSGFSSYKSVLIGSNLDNWYDSGIAIGSSTSLKAVTIGFDCGEISSQNFPSSVAIGYKAKIATSGGISIGYEPYSTASNSAAIGYRASSSGNYSTAIGFDSAAASYSTSIGKNQVYDSYSTAIGSNLVSVVPNSIVFGMAAEGITSGSFVVNPYYNSFLNPTYRFVKLIATTVVSGGGTAIMTSDGMDPGSANMIVLPNDAIATISGKIIGTATAFLHDYNFTGDIASFNLAPWTIYTEGSSYVQVNDPVITLENHSTTQAGDWNLPYIAIIENSITLMVVNPNTEDVSWIASLTIESSQ